MNGNQKRRQYIATVDHGSSAYDVTTMALFYGNMLLEIVIGTRGATVVKFASLSPLQPFSRAAMVTIIAIGDDVICHY